MAEHLVQRGVRPDRIDAKGHGSEQPIATNSTPESRRRNRRVDIHVVPAER